MNRQIKFRAYHDGDMFLSDDGDADFWFDFWKSGLCLVLNEQFHECGSGVAEEYWKPVFYKDAPIMQFTGLTDKNGVDIYEDDILQYADDVNFWVVSMDDRGCFVAHKPSDINDSVLLDDYPFNIIGDIHSTSELLK